MEQIQQWTRESLRRRLHKSLSCDWMHPDSAHHFSLRQFYVQLDWKKKIHGALTSRMITLTSINELIKQISASQNEGRHEPGTSHNTKTSSVIIEGRSKNNKNILFI